jgi:hypothetical protein
MEDQKRPENEPAPAVGEEVRELAVAFAALGRSLFKGGRAVSVEVLRSLRNIVEQARVEIDKIAEKDKKP